MAQKIPFFNMFSHLLPPPELKLRLGGAVISKAVIDQAAATMELEITTRQLLSAEEIQSLEKMLTETYAFSKVAVKAEFFDPSRPIPRLRPLRPAENRPLRAVRYCAAIPSRANPS